MGGFEQWALSCGLNKDKFAGGESHPEIIGLSGLLGSWSFGSMYKMGVLAGLCGWRNSKRLSSK